MKCLIVDRGYDANRLRTTLRGQGTIPVIPGRRNRKRPIQYDQRRYKDRWRVDAMFCRLKDFRRIATRYDKLARNYLSAVALAAAVAFWLGRSLDHKQVVFSVGTIKVERRWASGRCHTGQLRGTPHPRKSAGMR